MPDLSLVPVMDAEGLKFFQSAVARSKVFLEYGCGGSTAYAANVAGVENIISVDTSKEWVDKVKVTVSSTPSHIHITHCDVGDVVDWGKPLNMNKARQFWRYMVLPWDVAKSRNLVPVLILVDGRFRVSSFLYSALCARVGTLIMFDDYLDRPEYFVVEKFCRLTERHGRMGVFCVDHTYSLPDLVAAIAEYSVLCD